MCIFTKIIGKKTIILLLLSVLGLCPTLHAASTKSFKYDVYFLGVRAGEQEFHISDIDEQQIRLVLRVYSSPAFSKFYKLDDYVEVYIDKKTLLPHKVKKIIQEGKFRRLIDIDFDYEKNVAVLVERDFVSKEKLKNITITLKENTFEIVSMMYYLMNQDKMSLNKNYKVYLINRKESLKEVDVKVTGKTFIRTKVGRFNVWCLSYQDGMVWLSEDKKIPLKMKYRAKFGHLTALLKSMSEDIADIPCGGKPFWTKGVADTSGFPTIPLPKNLLSF